MLAQAAMQVAWVQVAAFREAPTMQAEAAMAAAWVQAAAFREDPTMQAQAAMPVEEGEELLAVEVR
jgi:hypothetical protein